MPAAAWDSPLGVTPAANYGSGCYCPPGGADWSLGYPSYPLAPGATMPEGVVSPEGQPMEPTPDMPDVTGLPGDVAIAGGPQSAAPQMIGDFFGPRHTAIVVHPGPIVVYIPTPSGGGTVGRVKVADNNSALPRDRFFVDVNWFHNAAISANGADVTRVTPGVETTFINPLTGMLSSFEVRVPLASTLNSTIIADGVEASDAELGNVHLSMKSLVHRSCKFAVSLGLGIGIPSADDIDTQLSDGTPLALVENETVHLTPFWTVQWTPNPKTFAHLFVQYDFQLGSNSTYINNDFMSGTDQLSFAGKLDDQVYQFIDFGFGRWICPPCAHGGMGVAWTVELHHSRTVSDADVVEAGSFAVGNPFAELDLLNGIIGGHVQVDRHTTITVGYGAPLTSRERIFDGELRALLNWQF